jgi:hypothetical protein
VLFIHEHTCTFIATCIPAFQPERLENPPAVCSQSCLLNTIGGKGIESVVVKQLDEKVEQEKK